jgi:hypothetical protein
MHRRLFAVTFLAFAVILEGCQEGVPTVPNNVPAPTGQPAPVVPGVIQKPKGGKGGPSKPAPTTPNAL